MITVIIGGVIFFLDLQKIYRTTTPPLIGLSIIQVVMVFTVEKEILDKSATHH